MNGLRFDSARKTHLVGSTGTQPTKLTASVWIKPTQFKDYFAVIALQGQGDSPIIAVNGAGKVYSIIKSQLVAGDAAVSDLTLNTWSHVVVQLESGKAGKLYINGDLQTNASGAVNPDFTGASGFIIGHTQGSLDIGGDIQIPNGYLSDVYVVEEILEPTAFGALFPQDPSEPNRRWGPLDSAVVKDNINTFEPEALYDSRPNYDQKWSDGFSVVGSGSSNVNGKEKNAFDGDLTTKNGYSGGLLPSNYLLWTSPTEFKNVNVRLYVSQGDQAAGTVEVNGISRTITHSQGLHWEDFGELETFDYVKLGLDGAATNGIYILAIEINGRLLIDGPADNSQVWSDGITSIPPISANFPSKNGFDGNINTQATSALHNSVATWVVPNEGIDVTNSIKFYKISGDNSTVVATVDGSDQTFPAGQGTYVTLNTSGKLTKIVSTGTAAYGGNFRAVKVDGKLLIDAPAQWNTSQVWSDGCSSDVVICGKLHLMEVRQQTPTQLQVQIGFGLIRLQTALQFLLSSEYMEAQEPTSNTVFVNGTQIGGTGVFPSPYGWHDLTSSTWMLPINLNSFEVNVGIAGMNVSCHRSRRQNPRRRRQLWYEWLLPAV